MNLRTHPGWGLLGQRLCELHPQTGHRWGPIGPIQVCPQSKAPLDPTLKQTGCIISVSYQWTGTFTSLASNIPECKHRW